MSAELTYFIQEGVLVGKVGERPFHILALSGGGGGSTKSSPAASTNNPYMEGFRTVAQTKHRPHAHASGPSSFRACARVINCARSGGGAGGCTRFSSQARSVFSRCGPM